jgi:hypothetical protein
MSAEMKAPGSTTRITQRRARGARRAALRRRCAPRCALGARTPAWCRAGDRVGTRQRAFCDRRVARTVEAELNVRPLDDLRIELDAQLPFARGHDFLDRSGRIGHAPRASSHRGTGAPPTVPQGAPAARRAVRVSRRPARIVSAAAISRYSRGTGGRRPVRIGAGGCRPASAARCRHFGSAKGRPRASQDCDGMEGVAGSSPAEGFANRAAARFSRFRSGSADHFLERGRGRRFDFPKQWAVRWPLFGPFEPCWV